MSKVTFDRYTSIGMDRINDIEKRLNVNFPQFYKDLVHQYNRGIFCKYTCFEKFNCEFGVDRFLSFDSDDFDFIETYNSPDFDHYLQGIVLFAMTIDGSFIGFDYRKSSNNPSIVLRLKDDEYIDDKDVAHLADNFESFLDMLLPEPEPDDFEW